jgi:hypothetical protein
MKTLFLLPLLFFTTALFAQNVKNANVYPSNLEENMYFEKYDASRGEISGITFLILSDGDNSRDVTPAFEVSLYLIPEGSTSREDVIIIKTYKLDGLYHMGSREFKNEKLLLAGKNISPGSYRLGIWVNSNNAFTENTNDNATLFRGTIQVNKINTATPSKEAPKPVKKDDEWGIDTDNDEDDDGWY